MPLLILGALVFTSVAIYMYVLNNKYRFITTKKVPPRKGPSNIIYLHANIESTNGDKTSDKE